MPSAPRNSTPQTPDPDALTWTRDAVARRYGVTTRTVDKWRAAGLLTGYRVAGTVVRFRQSDVDALAERLDPRGDAA